MNYTTLQLIRDLFHFLKPYKKRFFLGSFLRVTSDIVWLFPPWALSEIINFATDYQTGQSLDYFWSLMITVWIIAIYHFITHDLAKYVIYPIAEKMSLDSYLATIKHMFKLDSQWHEKENTGNKIQRMKRGSESLNKILRVYIDLVVESTVNVIGVLIVLASLGQTIDFILITFFGTYFLLSYLLTKKAVKHEYIANIEWEKFDGTNFEAMNNINTIKALGVGEAILKILKDRADSLIAAIKKRVFWFRTRGATLGVYREIFRQILIFYTVWQVFEGNYEVGTIALTMFYFEKISSSAGELAEVSNEIIVSRIAMMRMQEILNEKPTAEISGNKKFNPNWKELKIQDLTFSYSNRKILDHLHFTIKRGEKVGLVGISGTGKSTLFKLLLKLYDNYEGEILFDNVPLKEITRESYLDYVSYVPQDTELFNLSLKDNVTLTDTSKKQAEALETAIETAHIKDFMNKLPNGVDSLIGEKGVKLSGGERQRVGIARAIYKNPEILFLDEATSHLDVESEKKIQEALHKFFQNTTALVIAHRLSTLKEMDRIIVIQNGKIIEEGKFESLIKKEGRFYELWKKQKF